MHHQTVVHTRLSSASIIFVCSQSSSYHVSVTYLCCCFLWFFYVLLLVWQTVKCKKKNKNKNKNSDCQSEKQNVCMRAYILYSYVGMYVCTCETVFILVLRGEHVTMHLSSCMYYACSYTYTHTHALSTTATSYHQSQSIRLEKLHTFYWYY